MKKYIMGFITGLLVCGSIVYAATSVLSTDVTYDNSESGLESTNVQDALDELFEKVNGGNLTGDGGLITFITVAGTLALMALLAWLILAKLFKVNTTYKKVFGIYAVSSIISAANSDISSLEIILLFIIIFLSFNFSNIPRSLLAILFILIIDGSIK